MTVLALTDNARRVLEARYLRRDSARRIVETPEELDAAPADVAALYRRAWELGLKGVAVYRYGSRASQVLELGVEQAAYQYEHASACDPEECRL